MTWGTMRTRLAAVLVPAVLVAEQIALGANGAFLAVVAASAQIVAAMIALVLLQPPAAFWRPAAPVLLLAATAILWLAVRSMVGPVPIAPDLVLPGLVRLLGLFAVLLAGGWIGYRRGLMRLAVDWMVLLGIVQILTGLALRQWDPSRVWGLDKGLLADRFTGTFLNANASGCLFGVVALLGLGRWLALIREGDATIGLLARIVPALGLFAGLGACAITGSRTALALTVIALLGLGIGDAVLRRFLTRPLGIATITGMLVGVATLFFLVGDVTFERVARIGSDTVARWEIWGHYADVAGREWFWGYGPLSFDPVNLAAMRSVHAATMFWYIHSPHNALLSAVLGGGIPYLLLCGATIGAMLLAISRRDRTERQDPILRSMLTAALLILACSMVDIALDVPAIAALAVMLLAMPWGRAVRRAADRRRRIGVSESPAPVRRSGATRQPASRDRVPA